MFLLSIFEFAVTICIAGLFITQMMMPLIFGTRFFPMFRNTELKQQVDATRDEVADLKDQTIQLTELEQLLQQKHDLEAKIAQINNPEGTK
jgi:hypothetical protein